MLRKPPAFQFYVKDWIGSQTVLAMSPRQCGYYINLLANAWNGNPPGTIPNDPEVLWKMARAESREQFEVESEIVLKQFPPTRTGTTRKNYKLCTQFVSLKTHSQQKSDAAKLRWAKEKDNSASASAMHVQCSASASASASAPKNISTFIPPTQQEVSVYMQEQGFQDHSETAQRFIDYYEVRGWVPGNSKVRMKSWKAAVRTWKGNQFGKNGSKPQPVIEPEKPKTREQAWEDWLMRFKSYEHDPKMRERTIRFEMPDYPAWLQERVKEYMAKIGISPAKEVSETKTAAR